MRASSKFFALDEKREGSLNVANITLLVDDILQEDDGEKEGNNDKEAFIRRAEIKDQILERIQRTNTLQLTLSGFLTLFEECVNYVSVLTRAREHFNAFDANHDGRIEGEELDKLTAWVLSTYHPDSYVSSAFSSPPSIRTRMKEQLLMRVDLNHDGAIDLTEFTRLFEEMTSKIDVTFRAKKKFAELSDEQLTIPSSSSSAADDIAIAGDGNVIGSDSLSIPKLLQVTEFAMEGLGSSDDKSLACRLVAGRLGMLLEDSLVQCYYHIATTILTIVLSVFFFTFFYLFSRSKTSVLFWRTL